MTELQVISRILEQKSISILTVNNITTDYFVTYNDEICFINNHYQQYNNIPDKETFLAKFQDVELVSVDESDRYLIDTLCEEYTYVKASEVINKVADLMQDDSRDAVSYLQSNLHLIQHKSGTFGQDIISTADKRLEQWKELKNNPNKKLIPTGFEELDEQIGGFNRGEELAVVFARTGQSKTFVIMKMLTHMWQVGFRVGIVEPEMTANKLAYRFDTLNNGVSNRALTKGYDVENYVEYVENLKQNKVPFFVARPRDDFNNKITVTKLKSFVEVNKLDVLAIDGIGYMTDERMSRGDSKAEQLTHISSDLMDLSQDLKIPIIVVTQSNRQGVREDDLGLENIKDSDGIAHAASKVIWLKLKENTLTIGMGKHRDGKSDFKLNYSCNLDIGEFVYEPIPEDEEHSNNNRKRGRGNKDDDKF